jgi:hypothetical protein
MEELHLFMLLAGYVENKFTTLKFLLDLSPLDIMILYTEKPFNVHQKLLNFEIR